MASDRIYFQLNFYVAVLSSEPIAWYVGKQAKGTLQVLHDGTSNYDDSKYSEYCAT